MGAPISYPSKSTPVILGDGAQLSPFGQLRVSNQRTLFDSQQEYGLDTLHVWDITANGTLPPQLESNSSVSSGGNAVGPTDANTRMTPITASGTNGHYAILQSRQYVRYIPGHGHLIFVTGIFAAGAGAAPSFVLRSSTSGGVVDTAVAQASWNVDKLDGTGASGVTIDFTKVQILVIDAQMLYAGRVRCGFDVNGKVYFGHYFNVANAQAVPTLQTFNLPVRMEIRNTGAATCVVRSGYFDSANGVFLECSRGSAGGTAQFICASVQTEGGQEERGFPKAASNGATTITVTTRRPVLSIRPRELFQAKTNRGHIELLDFVLRATTNDSFFEVVTGGTLTGASWVPVGNPITAGSFIVGVRYVIASVGTTNFTLIGAAANTVGLSFVATGVGAGTGTAVLDASLAEFDVSANAISGGETITGGYALSTTGTNSVFTGGEIDLRNPVVLSLIDALTANQIPVSIVCTTMGGNSVITAGIHWHEQTI